MRPFGQLLRRLRRDVSLAEVGDLSDAHLLERFALQHEDAAFAALVRRHGPLVLGVCRRVLHNPHDAEDAFQATFLILARKAQTIRKSDALGSWLYGVAYRVALKARARAVRRCEREAEACQHLPSNGEKTETAELRALLDEELNRLPNNYRAAVVLHHLEGRSVEEAARQLGWKEGQFRGALYRGRLLLQERLRRRGAPVAGGILVSFLATDSLSAAVPDVLGEATVEAASVLASGGTLDVTGVAWLVQEGTRDMMLFNVKTVVVLLLMAGSFGAGAAVTRVWPTAAVEEKPAPEPAKPAPELPKPAPVAPPAERKDLLRVPSARDGVLADVMVKEGDIVKEGQLLFRLDDSLAAADVKIQEARVEAARADAIASEKTKDESYQRWDTQKRLLTKSATSMEDVRSVELTYIRYRQEEISKREALTVALQEMAKAKLFLETYTVRSPAAGVIHEIHKRRGEAVNRLETVLLIALPPSGEPKNPRKEPSP
jgi:RNA polymerase sigma factor (sigma-70 family)